MKNQILYLIKETGEYDRMDREHIFHDLYFRQHFEKQIQGKLWKCSFPDSVLLDSLLQDSALYKEDSTFTKRRKNVIPWLENENQWEKIIFGACEESASHRIGPHSQVLKTLHIFDAFRDFTDHINCFYAVASTMSELGEVVRPVSQFSYDINGIESMDHMLLASTMSMDDKMDQHASEYSHIHDIDKLDPVMLVGYSERFEDNVVTSLWDLCVERHVRMNPHHQGHNLWHNLEEDELSRDIRADALREMVCDKVSRRVQKNLDGIMSKDMWDVEIIYYKGLPQDWMENADRIMTLMKQRGMCTVVT